MTMEGEFFLSQMLSREHFRYLNRADRLADLGRIANPLHRAQVAWEIMSCAFDSLKRNSLLTLNPLTDEALKVNKGLERELFGNFRPTGKLMGVLHIVDNMSGSLTIGVFEQQDGEVIVHRTATNDWRNFMDGSTAVIACIAGAIRANPSADMSIVLSESNNFSEVVDLVSLGFRPDEHTTRSGGFTPRPRFTLEGAQSTIRLG